MLAPPNIAITIHGVGYHEEGQVSEELSKGFKSSPNFKIIDFNWTSAVESYGQDKISQLSNSIAFANSHSNHSATWLRAICLVAELVWGLFFNFLIILPVLFFPLLMFYLLYEDFSIAEISLTRYSVLVLKILFFASCAVTLSLIFLSGLLILFRRNSLAIFTLRTAILMFLRPFLAILFWFTTLTDFFRGIAVAGFYLIAFNVAGYLVSQGLSWLFSAGSWDIDNALTQLRYASLVVGAAFILTIPIGILAQVFAQPIKFLRDVFNYVGDPETRCLIQNKLTEMVTELPTGSSVVILSHSLGTVIAVDSLISSKAWSQLGEVSIVTSGSPIRRFFWRFFPFMFFPNNAQAIVTAITKNTPLTAWINIYRERDPVGTVLDLPEIQGFFESSTNQPDLKGIKAHSHYWMSDEVHAIVTKAWQEISPICEIPVGSEIGHIQTSTRLTKGRQWASKINGPVLVLAIITMISVGLHTRYIEAISEIEDAKTYVLDALEKGDRVAAEVTHVQQFRPATEHEPSIPVQKYKFKFLSSTDNRLKKVPIDVVEGERSLYIDSDGILEKYRTDEDLNVPKQFLLKIAYIADVPNKVIVPKYLPTICELRWYDHLFGILGFLIFGVVVCGTLSLMVASALGDLFLTSDRTSTDLEK